MSKIYAHQIDSSVLNNLHSIQVEILDEIVGICEKNNLRYYLSSGTLLGAARHRGFIPWDDDLDIAMPREDYEKFSDICISGGLNEKYSLHSWRTDDTFWLRFGKVRKTGTEVCEKSISEIDTSRGIYVDIFPLDTVKRRGTPSLRIRTYLIQALSSCIYCRRGLNLDFTRRAKVMSAVLRPFSIKFLNKVQYRLMTAENSSGGDYYIDYGSNYGSTVKHTILKSKYEPCEKLLFEGKYYCVPREYDYILSQIYDDYMQLPPPEMRVLRHNPVYIDLGK